MADQIKLEDQQVRHIVAAILASGIIAANDRYANATAAVNLYKLVRRVVADKGLGAS